MNAKTMLGYSKYWTAGFSASQWREITHHKEYGWAEFYFIFAGMEYDNHCQAWGFEFYFMGLRFWLCISDPWGTHPSDLENVLAAVPLFEEFKETNPELFPKTEEVNGTVSIRQIQTARWGRVGVQDRMR